MGEIMKLLLVLLLITFFCEKNEAQDEDSSAKKVSNEDIEEALVREIKRFRPKNLAKLGQELWEKEKKLDVREMKLKRKEEQITLNEKILEKKIKDFQSNQEKILGCIDRNDKDKSKRVNHMVEVISGMRTVNAAEILSVQEEEISIKILGLLPAEKVSKIFNLMDKEISARLQKQFMGMKQ